MSDRRTFLKTSLGGLAGLAPCRCWAASRLPADAVPAPAARAAALATAKVTDRVSVITGAPGNVVVLSSGDGVLLVDSGSAALAPAVRKQPGRRQCAHAVQHALSRRPDRRKRAVRQGRRRDPRAHHHQAVAGGRLLRAGGRPLGEGAAEGSRAHRDVPRQGRDEGRRGDHRVRLSARGAHARRRLCVSSGIPTCWRQAMWSRHCAIRRSTGMRAAGWAAGPMPWTTCSNSSMTRRASCRPTAR